MLKAILPPVNDREVYLVCLNGEYIMQLVVKHKCNIVSWKMQNENSFAAISLQVLLTYESIPSDSSRVSN